MCAGRSRRRPAPRALDEAGQRRLLRAAEAAPIRARALVMLMLFTALRISETVALDLDELRTSERSRNAQDDPISRGLNGPLPLRKKRGAAISSWLSRRHRD